VALALQRRRDGENRQMLGPDQLMLMLAGKAPTADLI
jgi:hypothetical protein